ncbi:hypothetical protein KC351_g3 [Hortaea werneckii]|nr:hypothetical protein KC351_g3 [Hortaea werneckii]
MSDLAALLARHHRKGFEVTDEHGRKHFVTSQRRFLGSSDVQRLNDHLDWRTHKGVVAQGATEFDRPGLENRLANHSGLGSKTNSNFDRNASAVSNSYDTAQYQSRARFNCENTDTAMGDGPLQPADDELDEDDSSANYRLTDLRQTMTKMECFNVSDEERVKKFLLGRISKLHQLSNKKRGARIGLLSFHRARPRKEAWPTPEQLKAWNKDTTEPSKTHRFRGWTAFLRELTPVDSLDDVSPTDKKMVHYRRKLFKELYDVAEMEQEWKEFGIDRQFHYTPDPEKKVGRRSTKAAASIASDDDESASTRRASVEAPIPKSVDGPERPSPIEHELPQPAQLVPSMNERVAETRYEDLLTLPGANDVDLAESKSSVSSPSEGSCSSSQDRKRTALVPARHRTRRGNPGRPARKCLVGTRKRESSLQPSQPQTRRKIEPQWQQWQAAAASLNNSFGDAGVNGGPVYNGQPPATAPSFFPGSHQSAFAPAPQYHQPSRQHTPTPQQNQLQVYNALHVPQPHFEPAPYIADFSPSGFAYTQDPQTANPPMPMPNYGLPVGGQNAPSGHASVPYLPPANQFPEEQSHPMHNWEEPVGRSHPTDSWTTRRRIPGSGSAIAIRRWPSNRNYRLLLSWRNHKASSLLSLTLDTMVTPSAFKRLANHYYFEFLLLFPREEYFVSPLPRRHLHTFRFCLFYIAFPQIDDLTNGTKICGNEITEGCSARVDAILDFLVCIPIIRSCLKICIKASFARIHKCGFIFESRRQRR